MRAIKLRAILVYIRFFSVSCGGVRDHNGAEEQTINVVQCEWVHGEYKQICAVLLWTTAAEVPKRLDYTNKNKFIRVHREL